MTGVERHYRTTDRQPHHEMSFFSRRKAKGEGKEKKKWQLDLEQTEKTEQAEKAQKAQTSQGSADDNDNEDLADALAEAVVCAECKQGPQLFCLQCEKYLCVRDFDATHRQTEEELVSKTLHTLLADTKSTWAKEDEDNLLKQAVKAEDDKARWKREEQWLELNVHAAAKGDRVSQKDLAGEVFQTACTHPAAVSDLVYVRAREKTARERERSGKRRGEEEEKRKAKREKEREKLQREMTGKALQSVQESGKLCRFRSLVGEGMHAEQLAELGVGWHVESELGQMRTLARKADKERKHRKKEKKEKKRREREAKEANEGVNGVETVQAGGANGADTEHGEIKESHVDAPPAVAAVVCVVKQILAVFNHDVSGDDAHELFSKHGKITDMYMRHKGEAIITYELAAQAQSALALNNTKTLRAKPVFVNLYDPDGLDPRATAAIARGSKKKMCWLFQQRAWCRRGDRCMDAHHPRELARGYSPTPMRHKMGRRSRSRDRDRRRDRGRDRRVDEFGRDDARAKREKRRKEERERERGRERKSKSRDRRPGERSSQDNGERRDRHREREKRDRPDRGGDHKRSRR